MLRNFFESRRGVTILEVVVAVAVVGFAVTGFSKLFTDVTTSQKRLKLVNVRSEIYDTVVSSLYNPVVIRETMRHTSAGNAKLRECIDPSTANRCNVTSNSFADQNRPRQSLYILAPTGNGSEIVAGPPGSGRTYGLDGERGCTPGPNCPFQAVATFWAVCPRVGGNTPSNCPQAEMVYIRVQIQDMRASGTSQMRVGERRIESMPKDSDFRSMPFMFAVPVDPKEVMLLDEQTCDTGQRLTGYDKQGKKKCECLGRTDRNGRCRDTQCDPRTQFMSGVKPNPDPGPDGRIGTDDDPGGTVPVCKNRSDMETCWRISIQHNGNCGAGSQLVSVDYGACTARRVGKGDEWEINCAENYGTCCRSTL